jgi:hypothetical protein
MPRPHNPRLCDTTVGLLGRGSARIARFAGPRDAAPEDTEERSATRPIDPVLDPQPIIQLEKIAMLLSKKVLQVRAMVMKNFDRNRAVT